jgi:hypothetical protein
MNRSGLTRHASVNESYDENNVIRSKQLKEGNTFPGRRLQKERLNTWMRSKTVTERE